MPGAYEKQMHGPRYDRMVECVSRCRSLLDNREYLKLINFELPLLTAEVGRDKKTVEEFFYAGGLHILCEILSIRKMNSEIGDILPILNEFSVLLCKEHDPFDDDIGDVPLLVFFLSERHKFYVDINWMPNELTYMKIYVDAHLQLLCTPPEDLSLPEETRATAVSTLYMSLLTFPPHRVVSQMAECFHFEGCNNLLYALQNTLPSLWASAKGRRRLLQVVASVAFWGLGLQITWELTHSQLLWASALNMGNELRCPCMKCELNRRLQKVARDRDEFGVIAAKEAKQGICLGLVEAQVCDFFCLILEKIGFEFRKNKMKCSFQPLIPVGCTPPHYIDNNNSTEGKKIVIKTTAIPTGEKYSCDATEEEGIEKENQNEEECEKEKNNENNLKSQESVTAINTPISSGNQTPNSFPPTTTSTPLTSSPLRDFAATFSPSSPSSSLPSSSSSFSYSSSSSLSAAGDDTATAVFSSSSVNEIYRQMETDRAAKSCEDVNDPRLDDQARQLAGWCILLCSWSYEKLNKGGSILAHNNCQLLASLLTAVDLSDLRRTFDVNSCTFLPGVATIIEVISALVLQARPADRDLLLRRTKPTMEALMRRTSERLVETCGFLCEGWKSSMGNYAPLLSGMLQQIHFGGRVKGCTKMSTESFKVAVAACQCLLEGYEYGGVDIDSRTFLTSLITCMGVLIGASEYFKIPECRRRFVQLPHITCGWMASGGRKILEFYAKISNDDGCVYVREIAQAVILLAEKASALIPADQPDPAEELRKWLIEHLQEKNEWTDDMKEEEEDEENKEEGNEKENEDDKVEKKNLKMWEREDEQNGVE